MRKKMRLDETFRRELRRFVPWNVVPRTEEWYEQVKKLRAACDALSTLTVETRFNEILKEHGRAAVGFCVASTIVDRYVLRDAAEAQDWAWQVLSTWPDRPMDVFGGEKYVIKDGLNGTKVLAYARPLLMATTEYV